MICSLDWLSQNIDLCNYHISTYSHAVQTPSLAQGCMLNNILDSVAARSLVGCPILAVTLPYTRIIPTSSPLIPWNSSCHLSRFCSSSLFKSCLHSSLCLECPESDLHLSKEFLLKKLSSNSTSSRIPCWTAIALVICSSGSLSLIPYIMISWSKGNINRQGPDVTYDNMPSIREWKFCKCLWH